jgi:hypothetical protein
VRPLQQAPGRLAGHDIQIPLSGTAHPRPPAAPALQVIPAR